MFKSHLEYCWTILLVSQTLVYVCMCCTVVRMWQLFDNLILCAMCIRFCGITMQQRRWEMRFSVDNCDTFEMVYSFQRNSTTFSASTLHYIPIFFFSQPQYVSTLQHFSMQWARDFFLLTAHKVRKSLFVSDAYDTNFRVHNKYSDYNIDRVQWKKNSVKSRTTEDEGQTGTHKKGM